MSRMHSPGVTNKILAKSVDVVFAAMPDAVERLGAADKTVVVGNPVRAEISTRTEPRLDRHWGFCRSDYDLVLRREAWRSARE